MTDQLVKVLLLIPRKKENEEIASEQMQHRKCFRKVWATPEEREVRIKELQAIAGLYPEYKWRIYETINWRNLRKAYFSFQQRILEWQRNDVKGEMEWLQHYNSEWVSNLMRPENKDKKDYCFLIDKDDTEDNNMFESLLDKMSIEIVKKYNTVNGVHYLVKPFDVSKLEKHIAEKYKDYKKTKGGTFLKEIYNADVQKDGLQLVWISDKNRWFNRE